MILFFGFSTVSVSAGETASLTVSLDQAEKLRSIINDNFSLSAKQTSVFIRELQCNAQVKKDGYADFVCTLMRSRYDAAIFSGNDASSLVTILSEAGAVHDKGIGSYKMVVKNLHCRVTGSYSDGTFEHTCTAKGSSSIPVASN
ncbi:hypothetical protein GW915_10980 [bacterium]|nr:hypothetical protein [bacterium]